MTEPEVHLEDYQHGKEPTVWSGALWFGAVLRVAKELADNGQVLPFGGAEDLRADARRVVRQIPVEVKAQWPGIFDEFPYDGESPEDHAFRRGERRSPPKGL